MADNKSLKVKFNWTLRHRSNYNTDEKVQRKDKAEGKSRTARYVRKMKGTQPSWFKQHLEEDAARKRKAYTRIQDKSEKQKKEQRQKWSRSKQLQRNKGEKMSQRSNVNKRFKDLSPEEKKEYFKLKMKESRAKMTKQKKKSVQQKDKKKKAATYAEEKVQPDEEAKNTATKKVTRKKNTLVERRGIEEQTIPHKTCHEVVKSTTQPDKEPNDTTIHPNQVTCRITGKRQCKESGSKATFYRKRQKIIDAMPESPRSYAKLVETLTFGSPVTPRKKQQLKMQGFNNTPEAEMIATNVKKHVKRLSQSSKSKDRKALYAVLQASTKDPELSGMNACSNSKNQRTGKRHLVRSYLDRTCLRARRFLGVTRRSWQKVGKHKAQDIIIETKKTRSGISDEDALTIRNFWWSPEVSRPCPLKKRVQHGIPIHHLECSYTVAYQRFTVKHPGIKIGYVKFIYFRPKNVRHMRASERAVCCCVKCENVKLKLRAINRFAASKSAPQLSTDEASLSKLTMCTSESQFPTKACIDRDCANCGVKKLANKLSPLLETDAESRVQYTMWKRVEKQVHTKNKVSTIKVMDLVGLEDTLGDVVDELEQEMVTYNGHLFRSTWQQDQLLKAKMKIKPKSAVIIMDYAENYTCTAQDEVQSAHWVTQSVTIHPMMAFINSSDNPGSITNNEAIIFITDDLTHDADGVAHFLSIAYPYLKKKYGVQHVEEFSDCCATQYRCAKSFADISFSKDVTVNHNYFEASHGKSSADGLGAITKHAASMAVTRRQYIIRNAKDFFNFCEAELTDVGKSVFPSQVKKYMNSSRTFFYCEAQNTNRDRLDRNVKTVKGTIEVHCVTGTGEPYNVRMRNLTCTCDFCWFGAGENCQNEQYVGTWKDINLQLKCTDLGSADDEAHIDLHVDDFVAVCLQTARGRNLMYLAKVLDIADVDILLRFLASSTNTPGVYTWKEEASSWLTKDSIIGTLTAPQLLPGRGLLLKFNVQEVNRCHSLL